jgi:hypothetical protein
MLPRKFGQHLELEYAYLKFVIYCGRVEVGVTGAGHVVGWPS